MTFRYEGPLGASKSLFNRALIAQSFKPNLLIHGRSLAEDVLYLKKALHAFFKGEHTFFVGDAGTSLRFLALRLSREKGDWQINGSTRLFSRPQKELCNLLTQLGCSYKLDSSSLRIQSKGWNLSPQQSIAVDTSESSQFLSGLFLSSWQLEDPLTIEITTPSPHSNFGSQSYFEMTHKFLSGLGHQFEWQDLRSLKIPAGQKIQSSELWVEPDMSSVAALLIAATLSGEVCLYAKPPFLQPDSQILSILKSMGGQIEVTANKVQAKTSPHLKFLIQDCDQSPDLVPCLAVLCAFAEGVSELKNIRRLAFKESQRQKMTLSLLKMAGITAHLNEDSLFIHGLGINFIPNTFDFDPDQDHRMAMAAGLFKLKNSQIQIQHPEVVNKSFPEFWSILRISQ